MVEAKKPARICSPRATALDSAVNRNTLFRGRSLVAATACALLLAQFWGRHRPGLGLIRSSPVGILAAPGNQTSHGVARLPSRSPSAAPDQFVEVSERAGIRFVLTSGGPDK